LKPNDLTDDLILDSLSKNQTCLNSLSKDLKITASELETYLSKINEQTMVFYVDGGARNNPGESGIGIVEVRKNKGLGYYEYTGISTNNESEYRALIRALEIGLKKGAKSIQIFSDSELVCHQINGKYKVKSETLSVFYKKAINLISGLDNFKIDHVLRNKNKEADRMVNMAIDLKKNGKIELAVAEL